MNEIMNEISTSSENYPSLSLRIKSSFIDVVVILVLMILFMQITDSASDLPNWVKMIFLAFLLLYEPLLQTFGCTLGNYLMGIRVRQVNNTNKRIDLLHAIVRFIVKILLGWVSFLTIHSNIKRRAIHDMASGSVVLIV